ncbi:MAG: hypothetical protein ABR582_04070 [Gemmatimonadaceae bacterium]
MGSRVVGITDDPRPHYRNLYMRRKVKESCGKGVLGVFLVGIWTALALGSACAPDVGVSPPDELPSASALGNVTVAQARLNVGEDGRFVSLEGNAPGERTAGEAIALANAYSESLLGYIQTWIEETRGGPINPKQLKACGRPLYASSVFEPLPESEPAGIRNGFGAYWLVTLCSGTEPQVSLAVSATRAGAALRNGKIQFGDDFGGEFFAYAIPRGDIGEFPLPPEAAVAIAAQQTGARARSTPRLVLPLHSDGIPQNAKWEIQLRSPGGF